ARPTPPQRLPDPEPASLAHAAAYRAPADAASVPSAAQPAYAVGEATTPAPEEEEAYAQEQPPAPPPTVEPSREASAARAEGSSPGEPDTSPAVPPRESATPYQPEIAP